MNLFQILAVGVFSLLLVGDTIALLLGRRSFRIWMLRTTVWCAVMVGITVPALTEKVAVAIGIGRGADVVLYVAVCMFVVTALVFYSWQLHLQSQITQLVRIHAIENAKRGPDGAPGPPPAGGST